MGLGANIWAWMTRLPFTPSRDTPFQASIYRWWSWDFSLATLSVSFADISSRLLSDSVSGPRPQPSLYNSNEHVSLQISPKLQIHTLSRLLDISIWCPLAISSLTGQKGPSSPHILNKNCTTNHLVLRSKSFIMSHRFHIQNTTQIHHFTIWTAQPQAMPLSFSSRPQL